MNLKTQLNLYKPQNYSPGRSKLVIGLWMLVSLVVFESGWFPVLGLKRILLRAFGASIGTGVIIKPQVKIKFPWKLQVGSYSWIGEKVWIDNLVPVTIGAHCCVSQGAYLCCGNHQYSKPTFDLITQPIELKQGVWLAAQSMIAPGTTVEEHCVVTAGSVLSGSTEPYTVYRGNPAVKIRMRKIN
jgi:putative colanic acid biosynthesis acetyltransferase WcaF